MSKVLKCRQWVEATPCRVKLPDPEDFLVRDNQPVNNDLTDNVGTDSKTKSLTPEATAQAEAAAILKEAKAEAERILCEARHQAEQLRAAARDSGVTEGRRAGLEEIRQELAGKLTKAGALLSKAETEREQRILASETEILKLAVAIAEKILQAELELRPEKRLEMVKSALARFSGATEYKIRVNPADLQYLDVNRLHTMFAPPKTVELLADSALEIGDCLIETELGNIDLRLRKQLELILNELIKVERLQ